MRRSFAEEICVRGCNEAFSNKNYQHETSPNGKIGAYFPDRKDFTRFQYRIHFNWQHPQSIDRYIKNEHPSPKISSESHSEVSRKV